MDKKSFIIYLIIILVTFSTAVAFRLYQPISKADVDFSNFPLQKEGWEGESKIVAQYALDILKPKEIFSGSYQNKQGIQVNLLFDFFVTEGTFGGPHSPRNCLPGSGWVLEESEKRTITVNGRSFEINRIKLSQNNEHQVMDFWYVTNYGETSNDYIFKLHSMMASLTFQPCEVAFIRFITADTPLHREALNKFEDIFMEDIYRLIPFE
ncbi:MAG: EpsI family protein [Candidatus Zixiibacteriota bacterium]|nr:MAG: EpsI family protein [candidate division Zixibacteria bacterium]